jgi:hypothetical protein
LTNLVSQPPHHTSDTRLCAYLIFRFRTVLTFLHHAFPSLPLPCLLRHFYLPFRTHHRLNASNPSYSSVAHTSHHHLSQTYYDVDAPYPAPPIYLHSPNTCPSSIGQPSFSRHVERCEITIIRLRHLNQGLCGGTVTHCQHNSALTSTTTPKSGDVPLQYQVETSSRVLWERPEKAAPYLANPDMQEHHQQPFGCCATRRNHNGQPHIFRLVERLQVRFVDRL